MVNQQSLPSIPSKYQERFLLKRIDEQDIELTLGERNAVLEALIAGSRFAQIRKYTIMLNSIKSIDPMWGDKNIPPRPKEVKDYVMEGEIAKEILLNKPELDVWDSIYSQKQLGGEK